MVRDIPAPVTSGIEKEVAARVDRLRDEYLVLEDTCRHGRFNVAQTRLRAAQLRADARSLQRDVLRVRLPRQATAGAQARALVREQLADDPEAIVGDVQTVVTAMVNNAYEHGHGEISLRVRRRAYWFRIEVGDKGNVGRAAFGHERHGMGLAIIDRLARSWGVLNGDTRVWAELAAGASRWGPPALAWA